MHGDHDIQEECSAQEKTAAANSRPLQGCFQSLGVSAQKAEKHFAAKQLSVSSYLLPTRETVEDIFKDLHDVIASLQANIWENKLSKLCPPLNPRSRR